MRLTIRYITTTHDRGDVPIGADADVDRDIECQPAIGAYVPCELDGYGKSAVVVRHDYVPGRGASLRLVVTARARRVEP